MKLSLLQQLNTLYVIRENNSSCATTLEFIVFVYFNLDVSKTIRVGIVMDNMKSFTMVPK